MKSQETKELSLGNLSNFILTAIYCRWATRLCNSSANSWRVPGAETWSVIGNTLSANSWVRNQQSIYLLETLRRGRRPRDLWRGRGETRDRDQQVSWSLLQEGLLEDKVSSVQQADALRIGLTGQGREQQQLWKSALHSDPFGEDLPKVHERNYDYCCSSSPKRPTWTLLKLKVLPPSSGESTTDMFVKFGCESLKDH